MKKLVLFLLVMVLSISCLACTNKEGAEIYTTVYALDFVTKEIVKDKITVKSVYPKSVEIHDYEPTAKQLITMSKAELIIYIGQGLEPFIESSLNSTFKKTKCVNISENREINLVSFDGSHSHVGSDQSEARESSFDPHIWLDPNTMENITNIILRNILSIEKYKQYEDEFTNNALELIDKFKALTAEYNALLTTPKKLIIVDHDAYAYWTYRYNIERKSLRGDNDSSDPNSKELINIINIAIDNNIKYLLATRYEVQEQLITSYVNYFKEKSDLDCEVLYLDNLETLVEDGDYFSIMRNNLDILLTALN